MRAARMHTYHGSFWGTCNDLAEMLALAQQGQVGRGHQREPRAAADGEIVARAVVKC